MAHKKVFLDGQYRAYMIAPNDKVRTSVVFARINICQSASRGPPIRIASGKKFINVVPGGIIGEHYLVTTRTRDIIHITKLSYSNYSTG